ncbi:MAG: hypothetical protein JW995_03330 [Melioribacteraceae bacterium]|nr:hypothetical protein [Melioribacteraceae bacterium]
MVLLLHSFLKKYVLLIFVLPTVLNAQFYFFGRNKIQYEDFEWKVLKTEHFDIYYYNDFEEMAEIGASYAEKAFEEYKQKFNYIVTYRIPLIFYNTHLHFQQTNTRPGFIPEGVGGFFEFLKGRVVIPFLGSLKSFEHVIRHELVHVFTITKLMNSYSSHRVAMETYPPLWFIEGLAEYWSTQWDSQGEMVMRDAVLNGIYNNLYDMQKVHGTFIMYKAGQKFLEFVSEEYGENKILHLLDNDWRFKKFNDLMEFVFGDNIENINSKFEYFLKKNYYPLYLDHVPHKLNSIKLTEFGFNFSPGFYDDGKSRSVYFIGNHDGYSSLYRLALDSTFNPIDEPELVIRGEKEAIYESFHLLKPSLAVSSKGILAFITKSGANDKIHFYSIEQQELVKRFSNEEIISIQDPDFSSDGTLLIFTGIDWKGYNDLYSYNLHTNELSRLTNDYYSESSPRFNNDDSKIYFISDRTEGIYKQTNNIFEFDLTTYQIKYQTYLDSDIKTLSVNKFTDELFFTSDYDGIEKIWKLVFDKNEVPAGMLNITSNLTTIFDFIFVDSDKIITSAIEEFSFQFYLNEVNEIEDSAETYVTFEFDIKGRPWEPDKIVITSEKDRYEYGKEYTLDYAVSQVTTDPVFGTRGGALLTLSDLLGDDRYLFLIYNTAEIKDEILKNFNVAISRVNTKFRTNYGYGVFHFNGRRYDIRESEQYFYERSFGGYLSVVYPFSQFQRIESSVVVTNSDKELFSDILRRKALLITNTMSFVHDNSIWGPTGPLDGSRFKLLLAYTSDVKYSNVNYYSFIADYRNYFRLSYRSALAFRVSLFYNHGKEARRYFAGGSWDLRGWRRFSIRGEKMWLSSIEYRFPLIDQFYMKLPFLSLGFANIRGAAFVDAGSAWDEEYNDTIGSVGVGFRINFLNALTLRYDIGKKIKNNFSDIQEGMFSQFFFGWDF